MLRVLKGAFIEILEVDTKVGPEIEYAVIFYFLLYIKNTMETFLEMKIPFYVLVPIQCFSVSWTLAAHLVSS